MDFDDMQDDDRGGRHTEMTLLDMLVVLIDSWKVLVIVPLLAAIIAGALSLVLPQQYETTALVQMDIDGRPDIILDSFVAAVAENPDLAMRLGSDSNLVRKQLVRDLRLTRLDGRGRMEISYRNGDAADARAVMDVVLGEFSKLMSEQVQKSAEDQRKVESLKHTIAILGQTVTELQRQLAGNYDLPAEQGAYERLVTTLVAVTTDLQVREDYLATIETAYTRYAITRPASTPAAVQEIGAFSVAGLWGTIAFVGALALVLLRTAIANAVNDPRASAKLRRIACRLRLSLPASRP